MAKAPPPEASSAAEPATTAAAQALAVPIAAVAEPERVQVSLSEFCARLSGSDRRVEMIGGFEAVERQAGREKDFEAGYTSRFVDFCNQPA